MCSFLFINQGNKDWAINTYTLNFLIQTRVISACYKPATHTHTCTYTHKVSAHPRASNSTVCEISQIKVYNIPHHTERQQWTLVNYLLPEAPECNRWTCPSLVCPRYGTRGHAEYHSSREQTMDRSYTA